MNNTDTDAFTTGNPEIDEAIARLVEQAQGAAFHVMVCDSHCRVLETIAGCGVEPFKSAFDGHGVKYMGADEAKPGAWNAVLWYV